MMKIKYFVKGMMNDCVFERVETFVRAMERMHITGQHIGFANELTVIYTLLASNSPVTFWILEGW